MAVYPGDISAAHLPYIILSKDLFEYTGAIAEGIGFDSHGVQNRVVHVIHG